MEPLIHSIQNIHLIDSKIDEEDSYILLSELNNSSLYPEEYTFPSLDQSQVFSLVTDFCFFCGKVKDANTKKYYTSNIPLTVFRYIMLEDGSYSQYYTLRKKPGYVVEGMHWSNGYFYQVRENTLQDFTVYKISLFIDSFTKKMYNFPEPSDLYESSS